MKKKLSSTQIILIIGIVLILAAILAVGVLLLTKKEEQPAVTSSSSTTGNLVIDENNLQEASSILERKAADNMFEVDMNPDWEFDDGKSASTTAYVANSTANSLPFYITVALEDTGEVVYESTVVPVGSALKEVVLTKDLDPGRYNAVCTYHNLYEDNTIESEVAVMVSIYVKG